MIGDHCVPGSHRTSRSGNQSSKQIEKCKKWKKLPIEKIPILVFQIVIRIQISRYPDVQMSRYPRVTSHPRYASRIFSESLDAKAYGHEPACAPPAGGLGNAPPQRQLKQIKAPYNWRQLGECCAASPLLISGFACSHGAVQSLLHHQWYYCECSKSFP